MSRAAVVVLVALAACGESALFGPLRAFAPAVIPALGETKWVKKALDELKAEVEKATND